MAGMAANPGDTVVLLQSLVRPAGVHDSDPYWLLRGGGIIVILDVTDVQLGGTITTVRVQAKSGENFETVAEFPGLAIAVADQYYFRMGPGASRAAGASAYKGAVEDYPPLSGRVEVVQGTNTV